uniref:Uncharacterized protein LOC104233968 isoform X11 n=1 Tax=Nicotiana sylvestris TaxID=4096 RepID=A0A1U7X0R7_NICSY|nr:PREDICTED: uncharacterized protein LOC104233968 isoform X11 [Nicotiana sylvestris]
MQGLFLSYYILLKNHNAASLIRELCSCCCQNHKPKATFCFCWHHTLKRYSPILQPLYSLFPNWLVLSEDKPKAKIMELCRKGDAFIRGWKKMEVG